MTRPTCAAEPQVRLEFGNRIGAAELRRILGFLPLASRQLGDDANGPDCIDETLMDLMHRYGSLKEDVSERRPAAESKQPRAEGAQGLGGGGPVQSVEVSLQLERARGVGRAELYCIAFVGDRRPGAEKELEGNRLFQTEVRPGRTEEDWVWDEVRIWILPVRPPCVKTA